MEINSTSLNLNAMQQAQTQMNNLAQDVVDITNPATQGVEDTNLVGKDLIDAIVQQIPTQIAYEANATSIKVENAVLDSLLDIKA